MKRRVLVVDDSEVTRAILSRTLRAVGFDVLEARDGVEGAVLALRELPSVVITDLEMPTMDGFPLLRLLKAEPSTAAVPVLILTSHGEAASRFWSQRTGADAYLTKDYLPGQLVEIVEQLAARASTLSATGAMPVPAPPSNVGPLDVLARVARQLDASLLQATLVGTLLERGMAAADFHEASATSLATIGEVVDARFLAVGVGEPETAMVHVTLQEAVRRDDLDALAELLVRGLEPVPGTEIDLQVSGHGHAPVTSSATSQRASPFTDPAAVPAALRRSDRDPAPPPAAPPPIPEEARPRRLDLDRTVWLALPVRGGRGVLALQPRDPQQFATSTCGLVDGLLGHLALVLDNARLSQRLHELSTLDGLTRQLNHRAIFDRLIEELERARRYRHPLTVILCDFDHFKEINDTHGHLAGDAVLRDGAALLRRCLRATDLLGRYGGEEFLAVMPQEDLAAGLQVAERLRRSLDEERIAVPGTPAVRVTASFGVAAVSELTGKITADLLVSVADRRLYEAKAAGRNRVRP
jgi:diguanylate cyclase (GGDEF)-like protein